MSRHFEQTLAPTLFVRLPKGGSKPVPGKGFLEIEHWANPVAIPSGRVAIVWNLVTLGLEGEGEPEPFQFDDDGIQFVPPPASKVTVVEGLLGRVSDTQWALVVKNERTNPDDGCFVIDYTFRLRDSAGDIYGPPIDPAILVTPDPTIPPG
jgi:hypothetical protein